MKKNERIQYYNDPINDDFAENSIKPRKIGSDYKYIKRSPVWRAAAFIIYYFIAVPVIFIISKLYLGVRVEGRDKLRKIKGGYFIYGNHTRQLDAFVPVIIAFPKRAYIVSNADAVSIKGLGWLTRMLGALPVPTEPLALRNLKGAIEERYREGSCVGIYPEAHVWPFYTGIRPFKSASFRYPAELMAPVFPVTTTYRRRRGIFRLCKKPAMTLNIGDAIYPDGSIAPRRAKEKLRNDVYEVMCRTVSEKGSVEYIRYIKKDDQSS